MYLPGSGSNFPLSGDQAGRFAVAQAVAEHQFVQRDVELQRFWSALWRRKRLLAAVFFGFIAVVAAFTLLQPKHYTTQVRLIAGNGGAVGDPNANTSLPLLNALISQTGVQTSETYAELLHESPIASEVAQTLNLPLTADQLLSHVAIKPVTNTNIISLAVTWRDAATSAQIANTFADVFVDHQRKMISRQADSALAFLEQQLPQAQVHMRSAQNALAAYEVRSGIADLQTQMQTDIASMAALEQKQQQAELEAHQAQAQLATVQQLLASTPQTIVGERNVAENPVTGALETQIAQTEVDLNSTRQQYTESHPAVVALEQKLAQLKREASSHSETVVAGSQTVPNPVYEQLKQQEAALQEQLSAAQAQAATAAAQRKGAQPKLDELPAKSRRIGDLQREAKVAEGVYGALEQKYQDALIARTTALSDVTITQPADPRVATVSPNFAFNLSIGIAIGLVLAISTVLLIEYLDDRFRTESDVRERLGLPVLATIPAFAVADGGDKDAARPLSLESFFQLVTSLRYSSSKPPRTIAVTSADQSEGKSTIAVNTAISMGMMNARVLVVDADLRRPTLHAKLGVDNDRGLSDVLVGVLPLKKAVRPSGHKGLWVLTSGRPAPNPVELLQGDTFDKLLAEARESFDIVILDAPALRSIVDGLVLGIKADGTLLVVSSSKTTGRAVNGAIEKLRSVSGLNLIGVVLNEAGVENPQYSNYSLGNGQSIALPPAVIGAGTGPGVTATK